MTVISADCCRPQRADSSLYRLVNHTQTHTHTNKHTLTQTEKAVLLHTQDDGSIFNQAQAVTRYRAACLVGCCDAPTPLNAGSFQCRFLLSPCSPVMNPVARLAWLRFLLHIPGRCQGPHRRQRSLPKSQPCYTDECVCPVL